MASPSVSPRVSFLLFLLHPVVPTGCRRRSREEEDLSYNSPWALASPDHYLGCGAAHGDLQVPWHLLEYLQGSNWFPNSFHQVVALHQEL